MVKNIIRDIKILFLFVIILILNANAQDTTDTHSIEKLGTEIDSLQAVICSMNRELLQLKQRLNGRRFGRQRIHSKVTGEEDGQVLFNRARKGRMNLLLEGVGQKQDYLQFKSSATAILQGGQNGGNQYSTGVASFDIYTMASLNDNTILFIDLEGIGGNGPDTFFPNYTGMNGDAGSTQDSDGTDRLTTLEAWAETKLLQERITVTAGKIDLTNYFDVNNFANDENLQFISGAFINSAAFAVPANSPGVRVETNFKNFLYLQLALSSSDNSGDRIFNDIYKVANIGWVILPKTDYEGTIRLYGYQHPMGQKTFGWGLSIDKKIRESFSIFGRYGENEEDIARFWGIKSAWSAGLDITGNLFGRTLSGGIAFGVSETDQPNLKNEQQLEVYVRYPIGRGIYISPHFQQYWNVNGTNEKVTLLGGRMHFNI